MSATASRRGLARSVSMFGAAGILIATTSGGCASAPQAPPPPLATSSAPPPVLPEEPSGPDVVRCGVDDAPVPVGAARGGKDARLALLGQPLGIVAMPDPMPQRAALPTVALKIEAKDPHLPGRALEQLLHVCAEQADPADAGEHALAISFGSAGAPRTTRPSTPAEGRGPSPFARCLAERACQLPVTPALAGKGTAALVRVTISPPVFRGEVFAGLSLSPDDPRKKDRRATPLVLERIEAFRLRLAAAATGCVERLPPADPMVIETPIEIVDGKPKPFAFPPSNDHAEVLRLCIQDQLERALPMLQPLGKLRGVLIASVRVLPHPPPEDEPGVPAQPVR